MRKLLITTALAIAARADIVIDLKNGVVNETYSTAGAPTPVSDTGNPAYSETSGYAKVLLTKKSTSGCPSTPYEAKVEINLAPAGATPLTKMSILVEYEGIPSLWHTHIGDDTINDGYGGGAGLKGSAELQVLDQDVAVYSTGLAPGKVDKLYGGQLRLTEGSLHFNIADQSLSIGQPYTVLGSPYLKQLFDFGAADKKIYAAFNRVVSDGSPRKGCGAKKVHLSFE